MIEVIIMAIKVAPLNSTFMLIAILGFLISTIWIYPMFKPWGFAFALVFALMFLASIVSMTYGPAEIEWDMDHPIKKARKKKK